MFGLDNLGPWTKSVFSVLVEMAAPGDKGYEINQQLSQLEGLANQIPIDDRTQNSFVYTQYFQPFHKCLEETISALKIEYKERFIAQLDTQNPGPIILEKRRQIRESGREITVTIPLVNKGSGEAIDVSVEFSPDDENILMSEDSTNVGNIRPGGFSISAHFLVVEPADQVRMNIFLEWGMFGTYERQQLLAEVVVEAQRSDINWDELERDEPYSTSTAVGDQFVGRKEKVLEVASGITRSAAQNYYISGQKRIGKTSLGLAIRDFVNNQGNNDTVHFLYLEWGDYAAASAEDTVQTLGTSVAAFLQARLPGNDTIDSSEFRGTLAPLNRLANQLQEFFSDHKFIIILDEFDEIHPDMYRQGNLAEAIFGNIRTLSGKSNIGFIMIGGENMPFIMSAQGDQLNRFTHVPLDYFDKVTEWVDYNELVTGPIRQFLRWHDAAVARLFDYTNGHPFYTNLISSRIYRTACEERDAEITSEEVDRAIDTLSSDLDINSFSHLWKDGVNSAIGDDPEVTSLQRCRLLVSIGRCLRKSSSITVENIIENKNSAALNQIEISPLLTEFCRRDVLEDVGGVYEVKVPFFGNWLQQSGLNKLIADTLGDEIAEQKIQEEEVAYVTSNEVLSLISDWPAYRAQQLTADDVRRWLEQVPSNVDQRLLFKLLQNMNFYSEAKVRIGFDKMGPKIRMRFPGFNPRTRVERRYDICVSYVDGPGKSGADFGRQFADVNSISTKCIMEMQNFSKQFEMYEEDNNTNFKCIIIVDDFIGTGEQMSENIDEFFNKNKLLLDTRKTPVVIAVFAATKQGREKVEKRVGEIGYSDVDLWISEEFTNSHFAFAVSPGIWSDENEFDRAKSLCRDLGTRVEKQQPLGFKEQGMLVTFSKNCPNNSLPLINRESRKVGSQWKPLFPRHV
jgi:hypothetical protein